VSPWRAEGGRLIDAKRLKANDRGAAGHGLSSRSPAQIASVLGCLTVTARGKLHRARRRFRAVFEELLAAESGHEKRMRPATGQRYLTKEKHEHA
jgi:hypothetical protein